MITERQQAVAIAAARKHNRHKTRYRTSAAKSRKKLKEQLGELLLSLKASPNQVQKDRYWKLFEFRLREYLAMGCCEVIR